MIPAEAVDAAYDKFRHLDITTSDVEGILEAAGDWLDEADFDKCNPDGYDYHRYLLSRIEAERVTA